MNVKSLNHKDKDELDPNPPPCVTSCRHMESTYIVMWSNSETDKFGSEECYSFYGAYGYLRGLMSINHPKMEPIKIFPVAKAIEPELTYPFVYIIMERRIGPGCDEYEKNRKLL
jgi:hypothetical protein